MERTKFYETLYKEALEFASSRNLIQQADLIRQNTTTALPKVVIKSSIKLFFYPLFKKDRKVVVTKFVLPYWGNNSITFDFDNLSKNLRILRNRLVLLKVSLESEITNMVNNFKVLGKYWRGCRSFNSLHEYEDLEQVYLTCIKSINSWNDHCVKSVQIQSYFWSEYRKFWTRNNSVFGHFSHSEWSWTSFLIYMKYNSNYMLLFNQYFI